MDIARIFGKGIVLVDCDQMMNVAKMERLTEGAAPVGNKIVVEGTTTIVYRIVEDPNLG